MNARVNNILYGILFTGLGLFSYLLMVNYTNLPMYITEALQSVGAALFVILAFNILGFSTISLSSWINNQYTHYLTRRWKLVAIYSAVTVMLFVINYGLLVSAKLLVGAARPLIFPNGGERMLIIVWLVELVILGLLLANKSIQNALKLQREAARLQQQNDEAKYTALQNQLNPHFLFNSLNTLIAEIEYDPRNAVVFTRNLSNVYRYVLQSQTRPLVTLAAELEFATSYLFLHSVRLGDCIRWNSDIPAQYMESQLPPLTLQLLVENVIKHNSITLTKPMEINVSIEGHFLVVSNSVNPRKVSDSSGVGLENLRDRCRLILYKDIVIDAKSDIFTVKIPMLNE